jgi:hypothetical protein
MAGRMADIESDMSAIHRVDDVYSLPGPRFFRLAWRLAAYQGCMRDNTVIAARRQQQAESSPAPQQARANPVIRSIVAGDPALKGIFSFGQGGTK